MSELYFIKIIVNLINQNRMPSSITKEEMRTLLLHIDFSKTMDIDAIELEIRKEIDRLAQRFGFIEALKRVYLFSEDARAVMATTDVTKHKYDLRLFSIFINSLYQRMEKIYSTSIYVKLYQTFPRIQAGTYDKELFLENVLKNSGVDMKEALGLVRKPDDKQIAFYEKSDETENSLIQSHTYRNNIQSEITRLITSAYYPNEIEEYLGIIGTDLASSDQIEHHIILGVVNKIRYALKHTKVKKSAPYNRDQLKIYGI